jgi:hypothetical protein
MYCTSKIRSMYLCQLCFVLTVTTSLCVLVHIRLKLFQQSCVPRATVLCTTCEYKAVLCVLLHIQVLLKYVPMIIVLDTICDYCTCLFTSALTCVYRFFSYGYCSETKRLCTVLLSILYLWLNVRLGHDGFCAVFYLPKTTIEWSSLSEEGDGGGGVWEPSDWPAPWGRWLAPPPPPVLVSGDPDRKMGWRGGGGLHLSFTSRDT